MLVLKQKEVILKHEYEQIKYYLNSITERLDSGYKRLNLNGRASKDANRYLCNYTTSAIDGDLTIVYVHKEDGEAVFKHKTNLRENPTKYTKMEPVKVKHISISFKLFYGTPDSDGFVYVSVRHAGMEYPQTNISVKMPFETIKRGLIKAHHHTNIVGEDFLTLLADTFIYSPDINLGLDLTNHYAAAKAVKADFCSLVADLSKEIKSRQTEESAINGKIEAFQMQLENIANETEEHQNILRLEAELKVARQKYTKKMSVIQTSLSTKHVEASDVLKWRREGDDIVRKTIRAIFKKYKETPDEMKSEISSELYITTKSVIDSYNSYSQYQFSPTELKYLAISANIPYPLVPYI